MNMNRGGKFYEKAYFHEMNRQADIDSRLKLSVSVFALLASVGVFLAEKIFESIVNADAILSAWSLLVIAFSIVIFGYLCYCVYRSLVGWKYHEIPLTKLGKYYNGLKQHYGEYRSAYSKQKVELMIEKAFERKLVQYFVECAEYNQGTDHWQGKPLCYCRLSYCLLA